MFSNIVEIISWIATLISTMMLASPLKVAMEWQQSNSVGDMSLIPFATVWLNCVAYTVYGWMIRSMALIVCSIIGLSASAYTLETYLELVLKREGLLNSKGRTAIWVIFIYAVLSVMLVVAAQSSVHRYVGYGAATTSIFMYGAPLLQFENIVRKKSAAVLVPLTIGLSIASNVAWGIFGAFKQDPVLYFPPIIGFSLCLLQAILCCVYGTTPPKETPEKETYEEELKPLATTVAEMMLSLQSKIDPHADNL